jgi:hypothetical protein
LNDATKVVTQHLARRFVLLGCAHLSSYPLPNFRFIIENLVLIDLRRMGPPKIGRKGMVFSASEHAFIEYESLFLRVQKFDSVLSGNFGGVFFRNLAE